MSAFDIAVTIVISLAVVGVIASIIYRKVKHKGSSCGCGCEGCPSCDKCKKD